MHVGKVHMTVADLGYLTVSHLAVVPLEEHGANLVADATPVAELWHLEPGACGRNLEPAS